MFGLGVQEFADIIGLTRQSVNNIENCKSKMSAVQFVAICAVLDHLIESQPDVMPVLTSILNSNDTSYENNVFENMENSSFLKKWFLCFPEDSRVITRSTDFLDNIVDSYKIFLDDSAIFEIAQKCSIENSRLIALMKDKSKRFIVPVKAVDTIQYQLLDENDSVNKTARNSIMLLKQFQNDGLVDFRGDETDINVMSTLVSVFIKFKMIHRLALITQNPKIARTVMALNNDDIGGFQIMLLRLNSDGNPEEWQFDQETDKSDTDAGSVLTDDVSVETPEEDDVHTDDKESLLTGWDMI